jgi:PQQ-dependent dehydrogenase (methanol/ethanol family)
MTAPLPAALTRPLTACALAVALALACTKTPAARDRGAVAAPESKASGAQIAAGDVAPSAGSNSTGTPADADAGQWLQQGKNYAQTRFSELAQITTDNVRGLKTAWTFSTGVLHGHEGAPLVVGSTMYVVTPYPDIAYALDLTQSGRIKWKYRPDTDPWSIGLACCDVVNRGWAYADGKLIYNLLDDRTIALDANTGKLVWQTKLGDVHTGETMTMSPLVVKDKVLVGNSGGEMGVQGWIAALDLKTGKPLWRAYNTGPDSMVKIGAGFKAFYAKDRGKDLGVSSWPPDGWRHGAGAAWGWISYDPDLNLIYYGTSNPGPWTQNQRPGDNKWTSTIFARDPDNGEARWANQLTPHDEHDYDAVNENILVDRPVNGRMRKLLVHFDRNAFAYTIDRETGEILVAKPFANENWATGVDLTTGAPIVNPVKNTTEGVNVTDICPPDIGGKDEQPAAYSPLTNLFYVPTNNMCMDYQAYEVSYVAGTPYWGAKMVRHPGPGGNYGEFIAWDATTGTKVWGIKEKFFTYSGVLVTAGGLAFYGTADGWFKAVDARTGQLLWQMKLGSGIVGAPITYVGPDGKQYVAILAGVGGAASLLANVPGFAPGGGVLYVFAL